jgi:hypothetical protein
MHPKTLDVIENGVVRRCLVNFVILGVTAATPTSHAANRQNACFWQQRRPQGVIGHAICWKENLIAAPRRMLLLNLHSCSYLVLTRQQLLAQPAIPPRHARAGLTDVQLDPVNVVFTGGFPSSTMHVNSCSFSHQTVNCLLSTPCRAC